jgi:hypothetical protein
MTPDQIRRENERSAARLIYDAKRRALPSANGAPIPMIDKSKKKKAKGLTEESMHLSTNN